MRDQIQQSLSGAGHCFENSRMESFFAAMKKKLLYLIPTCKMKVTDEKAIIFRYVFGYYNQIRIHKSNLEGLSPAEYRKLYENRR